MKLKKHISESENPNYGSTKDYSYHFLYAAVIALFLGVGMCLVFYSVTLISIFQFSKILVGFTFVGFLIPLKVYQKWFHFIKYETIIFNIIGVGPFLTGIFLLLNFFISTNTFSHQYRIEKVYIDGEDSYQSIGVVLEGNVFSGEPKIVELTDEEMLTIYKKKSLMLTVSEGVFGFEVIKEKKLLD